MFNKACAMPWCHTVVDFEVVFQPCFRMIILTVQDRSHASSISTRVISNAFRKTRTQLGPSRKSCLFLLTLSGTIDNCGRLFQSYGLRQYIIGPQHLPTFLTQTGLEVAGLFGDVYSALP